MEFGIKKCVMLITKSEKQETTEGIELANQEPSKCFGKRKITNT